MRSDEQLASDFYYDAIVVVSVCVLGFILSAIFLRGNWRKTGLWIFGLPWLGPIAVYLFFVVFFKVGYYLDLWITPHIPRSFASGVWRVEAWFARIILWVFDLIGAAKNASYYTQDAVGHTKKFAMALPPFLTELGRQMIPEILAAVIIAAGSAGITWLFAKKRYKQRYQAAAQMYVERIGNHIKRPVNEDDIIVHGKSIVAVRDDLKSTILTLDKLLNSEIDTLKEALKDPPKRALVLETIRVLQNKWPDKAAQLEVEIRKLLTELGLERF